MPNNSRIYAVSAYMAKIRLKYGIDTALIRHRGELYGNIPGVL